MKTVRLGKTGITSPKNAFGALPIQRVSEEYAAKLLRRAYEAGFTYFDTARAYSDSEKKIGIALADVREKIFIATKTGARTAEGFHADLKASLETLKTGYIDVYQFHNPPFCPKPGDGSGLYEAALAAKTEGKIRHIGITSHRPDIAMEAIASGLYETLQFPFSYLCSEVDLKIVRACKENDIGFISMKALSGGLITDAKAAFGFMNKFDNVLPIWGIQRESELEEFISLGVESPEFGDEAAEVIEKDRAELTGEFCRACGYCMPCPAGIQINICARMIQLIRRSPSAGWLTPESQNAMMRIEACLDCGRCKSKCPYGIDTPALLKKNLADYKSILCGKTRV